MKKWLVILSILLIVTIILVQFGDEIAGYISPSPTQTLTSTRTPTLPSTSIPTQTFTYTPVPSETLTITPYPSDTPTITPSPTSIFFDASIYSVGWLESGHLMISINISNLSDEKYIGKISGLDYPCRKLENLTDRLICVGQALEPEKEYKFTLFNAEGDELFFELIFVEPKVERSPSGEGGGGGSNPKPTTCTGWGCEGEGGHE